MWQWVKTVLCWSYNWCVFWICLARQNPQVPLFAAAFYGTGGPCGKGSRRCRWRGWITYCGWLGNPAPVGYSIHRRGKPMVSLGKGSSNCGVSSSMLITRKDRITRKKTHIYIYTVVFHEKMWIELANISSLCRGPGKWLHFVFWRAS